MIPLLGHYKEKWKVESEQSIKPGLTAIREAMMLLGHPEQGMAYVHIAGTNGKGSTLTFIEKIALNHKLSVGKFMSPCIVDLHDQIQIDETPITPAQVDAIFQVMKDAGLSGKLTDFELLTCIALIHFKNENVNLVLLEAGMGGREDSTNIVLPIVSVIPTIALEHTNYLGNTIEAIASHKAGIIKAGRPVVLGALPKEAMCIIQEEAFAKQSPIYALNDYFSVVMEHEAEMYHLNKQGLKMGPLQRQLLGRHQKDNMAIAITAFTEVAKAFGMKLNVEAIQLGVSEATVPGRFEEVLPDVYFDGAHNPASVEALAHMLQENYANRDIEIVLGILADKDVEAVLTLLQPLATKMIFIDVPNDRAMPAQKIAALSTHPNKTVVSDVVTLLQQPMNEGTIRVVTGSLYLLAAIRSNLRKM